MDEVESVATFYTMFYKEQPGKRVIKVCTSLSCYLRGCDQLVEHLEGRLGMKRGETTPDGRFTLQTAECLASCGTAPVLQVNNEFVEQVTFESADALIATLTQELDNESKSQEASVAANSAEKKAQPKPPEPNGTERVENHMPELIVTKDIDVPNIDILPTYRQHGGYQALEKALKTYQPDELVEIVKQSGLRGRGGAGFPTGMKWSFLPKESPKPRYLCCNADESEPGTFKDRMLWRKTRICSLKGSFSGLRNQGASRLYLCARRACPGRAAGGAGGAGSLRGWLHRPGHSGQRL